CSSLNHGLLEVTARVTVTAVCGAAIVSAIVVVRVRPPPVPVTVTVAFPSGAVAEAVSVSMLLLPVVDGGLNDALTPVGRPEAVRATLLGKLVRTMPIVLAPLAPRFTVRLAGVAVRVKPEACGVALTGDEFGLEPTAFAALTTKKYVVPLVRPVLMKDVAVGLPTVV